MIWTKWFADMYSLPQEATEGLNCIFTMAAFMADAATDVVQFDVRAMVAYVAVCTTTWLRNWDVDPSAYSVIGFAFHRRQAF